jgi:myo-inositol 2-dehydrogenase / D-chiro-inositol 1-dehydrogenase
MTVRAGVVGVGTIGLEHSRRLDRRVSGAEVVGLADVDVARAERVAAEVHGARVFQTGRELIRDAIVDAVVVASWGPTHEELVLAAIEQGKPVFCEKPLAPTIDACQRILHAEQAHGRRLVQVGFMRRYDAGYGAMKRAVDDGTIGAPLMVHCAHRNASTPARGFTSDMLITDAAIHEIDLVRWLLRQEIAAVNAVLTPRRPSHVDPDLQDPQILILEMAGGAIVDVEIFVNCSYGYDIRCEVVGERGTVELSDGYGAAVRGGGLKSSHVPPDWRERFMAAYDVELQDWIDGVAAGEPRGPSSWDGYVATVVAECGLEALRTGQRVPVPSAERPAFYGVDMTAETVDRHILDIITD